MLPPLFSILCKINCATNPQPNQLSTNNIQLKQLLIAFHQKIIIVNPKSAYSAAW